MFQHAHHAESQVVDVDTVRQVFQEALDHSSRPRMILIVDEAGCGQLSSTLSTEDTVRWLTSVAEDQRRFGTQRRVSHLN